METKYKKVKVSERLPDKTEWYYTEEGLMYWIHDKQYWEDIDGNEDAVGIDFYFEEVPDREDEMIDMLKNILDENRSTWGENENSSEWISDIESLLNSIKQ